MNSCNCKKQSYIDWNVLCLFKKGPKTKLKVFQCQILTLVKRSDEQLASKASFSTFLQLSCLNFKLRLRERSYSYKICKQNQILRDLGKVRSKKIISRDNHSQNV